MKSALLQEIKSLDILKIKPRCHELFLRKYTASSLIYVFTLKPYPFLLRIFKGDNLNNLKFFVTAGPRYISRPINFRFASEND